MSEHQTTGPCVRCVLADRIDGWGRCTGCARPEATDAEREAVVDAERVRNREGQKCYG
jgi:hypothetical protein